MFEKARYRTPFNIEHVKGSQTLVKSAWQHVYQISSSLWGKITWKVSLLVTCEILGYFVNTLIPDDSRENMPQPI